MHTTEYVKSFVRNTNEKITLYFEMRSGDWMYVIQNEKMMSTIIKELLLPKAPIKSVMDFDYSTDYHSTLWGKWLKQ